MPQKYQQQDRGTKQQRHFPSLRNIAVPGFQHTGQNHKHALSENGGYPVECASDSNEKTLRMVVESQHIIAVGGNIMSCRKHCRNIEYYQCRHKGTHRTAGTCGKAQRYSRKAQHHQCLHRKNPPSFGAEHIYHGAPQRFDYPRQVKKACGHCKFGVSHAETFEHGNRYYVHKKVRNTLRKIQGGDPRPRTLWSIHRIGRELFRFPDNNVKVFPGRGILWTPLQRHLSGTSQPHVPIRGHE